MGALFDNSPPSEDPNVARLRQQQEDQAARDKIEATQGQLAQETLQRNATKFGTRSLFGSALGKTSLLGAG